MGGAARGELEAQLQDHRLYCRVVKLYSFLWGGVLEAQPGASWKPRSGTTSCIAEGTNLHYRAESGRLWGGVLEAPARAVLEAALQDHRLYCRVDKSLLQG